MTSVQELAAQARAVNAANGWGVDFELDQIPTFLALVHSEVSEAWDAETEEEIVGELADVLIRCLDLCELILPGELGDCDFDDFGEESAESAAALAEYGKAGILLAVHSWISYALECYRKLPLRDMPSSVVQALTEVIDLTVLLMRLFQSDVDVTSMVAAKIEFNKGRGHRHGGRRV